MNAFLKSNLSINNSIENIVAKILVLGTGQPLNNDLINSLYTTQQNDNGWGSIASLVDNYMNQQSQANGGDLAKSLIDLYANVNMTLASTDAQAQVNYYINAGINSWSGLFTQIITDPSDPLHAALNQATSVSADNFLTAEPDSFSVTNGILLDPVLYGSNIFGGVSDPWHINVFAPFIKYNRDLLSSSSSIDNIDFDGLATQRLAFTLKSDSGLSLDSNNLDPSTSAADLNWASHNVSALDFSGGAHTLTLAIDSPRPPSGLNFIFKDFGADDRIKLVTTKMDLSNR